MKNMNFLDELFNIEDKNKTNNKQKPVDFYGMFSVKEDLVAEDIFSTFDSTNIISKNKKHRQIKTVMASSIFVNNNTANAITDLTNNINNMNNTNNITNMNSNMNMTYGTFTHLNNNLNNNVIPINTLTTYNKNINPKQALYIERRKQRREWLNQFMERNDNKYTHESRHKHAMSRMRAPSGRFLTKKETEELLKNKKEL